MSQASNTMAVKDGSGPQPAPHRAKRYFLNCLETSFNPCFFLPLARVQGPCRRPLNCLETSFNPCFFLPSARVQEPCRRPQAPWLPCLSPPRTAQHLLLVISSLTRSPCCKRGRRIIRLYASKSSCKLSVCDLLWLFVCGNPFSYKVSILKADGDFIC